MKIKKYFFFSLILLIFACNSSDIPENGSKWILINLYGKKIESKMTPFFTINTEKNTLSGSGSCNRFSASFLYDNSLKIKQILSTKMACKDNTVEKDFFNMLKSANDFKVEDNILKFYKSNKEIASFIKAEK